MKRLRNIGALALLALAGLWSCGTDTLTADKPATQGKGHKVSLTIGSTAGTRSAEPTNLGGFDREKAIDGDKLYAVVFDQQGKFVETIKIADYETTGHTCSFTLSDAGVYYGYIVANTSKGTELSALTPGTSTEDALYNIIEDTDPGAGLAASTNFLMVSKRTLLDVDGDADTSLGTVTLTRAVARIDIDATDVDGLAITQVVVENRYKKSLVVRGNSPDDTGLTAATPTDTKTYTRGTNSGEVDALSDGTGLVNDRQWQGVIYGYENINTNTVVKITHTLNGVASTTVVDFADANSGAGQAVKRNNIYTVKLTKEALTTTLNDIVYSITVVDWDNSVNLAYGKDQLTDHEKPDYVVTSGHLASHYTSSNLNPAKVLAKKADALTEITLQVTSHGKVASEVSFVDKTGAAYDFLGDAVGGSIEQVGATTYGTDGSIIQNYKITIPQAVITAMSGTEYLTFKVHNVFDDTSTGSREFQVAPCFMNYEGVNVGDILFVDGTTYSTLTAAQADGKTASQAVGLVVYVNTGNTEIEKRMTERTDDGDFGHVLVMALKDAGSFTWKDENTDEFGSSDYLGTTYTLPDGWNNGIVEAAWGGYRRTTAMNNSTHKAAQGAVVYSYAPGFETYGSTGWFLPSSAQFIRAIAALSGLSGSINNSGDIERPIVVAQNGWTNANFWSTLSTKLSNAVGGNTSLYNMFVASSFYWTSSETSATNARTLRMDQNYGYHYDSAGQTKNTSCYVRPFLAY